jgi:hypothetical protein
MAAPTQPQYIPKVSQDAFIQYHRQLSTIVERQWNLREQMRQIDMAYIREQDYTSDGIKARIANNLGDSNKIQNVTIPVVKPQVFSAVAYQCAVFCSSYPIFPIVAAPQYIEAAEQMQALLEENSIRGGWARELMLFFYDGQKYNLSALEVYWDKIVTAAIETDISYKGGQEGRPKEVVWEGNCLRRWDPYNTYFDTRVVPYDIPTKGEFAGHTELMSRVALTQLINSLETKQYQNIRDAFSSPSMLNVGDSGQWGSSYFLPRINPNALLNQNDISGVDWDVWMGLNTSNGSGSNINYRGIYEVSTEYIRIIPDDFGLTVPQKKTPQIWKLIIVNHSVIIYAERQTNAHDKIPVFFGCPSEDGLGYQTKSLAIDAIPFQQTASALMNSILASRRRAITDRVAYDPSRVSEAHINNSNPSAKIPMRPSAFGKPVSEAFYQFPFKDDQAAIAMQEIQAIVSFGNVLNGQNPVRQGQFVKGNKTDSQWESTMTNATSKDQSTALLYEAQIFTPMKEVLKFNYLQYQGGTTLYSQAQQKQVEIDPVALRTAVMNFKITDGYLPADKVLSGDTLKVALQVIGSSEQIAAAYNVAPLFSYLMKTENADIDDFEKSPQQVAYEQAMAQWSAAAQAYLKSDKPFNVPQPVPQQYGYDPQTSDPSRPQPQSTTTNVPVGAQNGVPQS